MNTDMTSGIIIETGLVALLGIAPFIQKAIGRLTIGEENAVTIGQAVLVAYVVKTCEYCYYTCV